MSSQEKATATPLAIIGIGCLFPKAEGLRAYWANICRGVDAITDVPPSHWDANDYFDEDPDPVIRGLPPAAWGKSARTPRRRSPP